MSGASLSTIQLVPFQLFRIISAKSLTPRTRNPLYALHSVKELERHWGHQILQNHARFVAQRQIRGNSTQGYRCQCPVSGLLFPDSGPNLFSYRSLLTRLHEYSGRPGWKPECLCSYLAVGEKNLRLFGRGCPYFRRGSSWRLGMLTLVSA